MNCFEPGLLWLALTTFACASVQVATEAEPGVDLAVYRA